MEQIYTIPVNEAFDRCAADPKCGCPFCRLFQKLEEDELDIILGASMMEPDIRMKTNAQGFCLPHYRGMLKRKRRLGMGLILESHLAQVQRTQRGPAVSIGTPGAKMLEELLQLEGDCYVCTRIEKNLSGMIATAVYLYESDPAFERKAKAQPCFCLPHYRKMMSYAAKKMAKKKYRDFYTDMQALEGAYLEKLCADVSWFCKKFDYRYDEEPWYDSKDSIERAIRFLCTDPGDIG